MLLASLYHQEAPATEARPMRFAELAPHREICDELSELVGVLRRNVTHTTVPARYGRHRATSRSRSLHASRDPSGVRRRHRHDPPRWDSGVKWLADQQVDLFAFTLDKTTGDFSPTTRYRDYAISRDLIHWESQSATSIASPTGTALPQPRRRWEPRSCCSPGSTPTIGPSGVSARRRT